MSYHAVDDCLLVPGLPPATKLVLCALASHADRKSGVAFPGLGRLAVICGMGDRQVREHLYRLVKLGLVQQDDSGRGGRTASGRGLTRRLRDDLPAIRRWADEARAKLADNRQVKLAETRQVNLEVSGRELGGKPPANSADSCQQESVTNPEPVKEKGNAPRKLDGPTDEHRKLARERGLDVVDQWARYLDWQVSSGKRHRDLAAGFRNWLRRAGDQVAERRKRVGEVSYDPMMDSR